MTGIVIAGLVAWLVSISLTPVLIRYFSAEGLGQEIREEGPRSHMRKRGTPTMGGLAIIAGIIAGYFAGALATFLTSGANSGYLTASGLLVLGLTVGMGLLGFLDDYIKLAKGRNLGLNKKGKIIGQIALALAFGLIGWAYHGHATTSPISTHLSFIRDIPTIDFTTTILGNIGLVFFLLFILFLVAAWSNAVNLTDGLDGLAAGSTSIVMAAYVFMTFWQYQHSCQASPAQGCFTVRDPHDLAILAACGLGACMGFLWWNAAPAKIFMGDTGSLALGGLVAGLSVCSRTELLMVIIGGLFVVETVSVVIQVAVFKSTGKRFFRMAPIHHHFENGGWPETTVVTRFWLITALCALAGVSLFLVGR